MASTVKIGPPLGTLCQRHAPWKGVEAARAVGNPHWRIALRHILPNVLPPLIVQSTLAIAAAVIAEASLSFLGLGQQPPAPSWGSMLNTAKNFVDQAPWMAIWLFAACTPCVGAVPPYARCSDSRRATGAETRKLTSHDRIPAPGRPHRGGGPPPPC
jgi:hypothetical protein